MRAIFLFLGFLVFSSLSRGEQQRYDLNSLHFAVDPPENFIRVDDKSPLGQIANLTVPATNHQFAVYVDRAGLLSNRSGSEPTIFPYFVVQTVIKATLEKGMETPISSVITSIAASAEDLLVASVPAATIAIRQKMDAKLREKFGLDYLTKRVGAQSIGTIYRSDKRVTILLSAEVEYEIEKQPEFVKSVCTMSMIDINSLPVMIYVYERDDGSDTSIDKLIKTTDAICSGISG
jgi:hypothetical protein